MSGGSWEYRYHHVAMLADDLQHESDPLRVLLGCRLKLMAEACRAVEWHDSGDTGPDDEARAIRAALEPFGDTQVPTAMRESVVGLMGMLQAILDASEEGA